MQPGRPFCVREKNIVLHHWLLRLTVVLAVAGTSVLPAGAEDLLGEISQLARGGTPHLAIRVMDQHQPPLEINPQAWARWERERIYIYEVQGDWSAVLARLKRLSRKVPAEFVIWAENTMARAEVELGYSRRARERLRGVWNELYRREWTTPLLPNNQIHDLKLAY